MNDSDLFESSANINKETCKCGHTRDSHDHDDECYHNDHPSGATGCLCNKFVGVENKSDDTWHFPLETDNWMWPDYPGTFGATRKFNKHPGLDLYCDVGTQVFAVEDGICIGIKYFTGELVNSPWWHNTYCILVKGKSGVVNYGEIMYDESVYVGDPIGRGELLGTVMRVLKKDKNRPTSMLHFELYKDSGIYVRPADLEEPNDLIDPAPKLKEAALKKFGKINYYTHKDDSHDH